MTKELTEMLRMLSTIISTFNFKIQCRHFIRTFRIFAIKRAQR